MDSPWEFAWAYHDKGYRWIETHPADWKGEEEPPGRYLTEDVPLGVRSGYWRYNPLDRAHLGLFRRFADLEPSEPAIQAFANAYGLLGSNVTTMILLPNDGGEATVGTGETLAAWAKEIQAMRRAITLWDAWRRGDRDTLARFITWDKERVIYKDDRKDGRMWALIAAPETHPEILARFPPGDVFLPAMYYVQRVLNDHLKGRVSPRLLWERDREKLGLRVVPDSLIGALWLQFAQAIDGDREFGRCETCGQWFMYDPDTARTNRRYCSDACRFKAYRRRQRTAADLHAQGLPVKEIAKRLASTPETVHGWISKERRD